MWLRWNGFDYDPERFWKAVEISVKIAGLTPHSKVSAQVLSLIPVFILIGYLAYHAKLTTALFEAANAGSPGCRAGLRCRPFSRRRVCRGSGASVATAAVFARIAIPEMLKIGITKQFAAVLSRRGHVGLAHSALGDPCDLCDYRGAGRGQTAARGLYPRRVFRDRLRSSDHRHCDDR